MLKLTRPPSRSAERTYAQNLTNPVGIDSETRSLPSHRKPQPRHMAILVFGTWDALQPNERAMETLLGVRKVLCYTPAIRPLVTPTPQRPQIVVKWITGTDSYRPPSYSSHRATFISLRSPHITSNFPSLSCLALAHRDGSGSSDSPLASLLHPTIGFRLPPTHHHLMCVSADVF